MNSSSARRAALTMVALAMLGCPDKRASVRDAGPAAPVPFVPPRDAALANRPPRPLDAKYLVGPGDIARLHVRGGMGARPIEGKTASASYDGVRYVGETPGPGITVEWQVFATPQSLAQRLQRAIRAQPHAPPLPELGPLAFAFGSPEAVTVLFADPHSRSVVSIACGAPVCVAQADGGIDAASLSTVVGLAKVAKEHLQAPPAP